MQLKHPIFLAGAENQLDKSRKLMNKFIHSDKAGDGESIASVKNDISEIKADGDSASDSVSDVFPHISAKSISTAQLDIDSISNNLTNKEDSVSSLVCDDSVKSTSSESKEIEKTLANSNKQGKEQETINSSDCAIWPVILSNKFIDYLIQNGPKQIVLNKYPIDNKGRHFSNSFYKRKLSNGEDLNHRGLIYSISKDSVYCFCCRLFDKNVKSKLSTTGFNTWTHLTETLKIHDESVFHKLCYQKWVETEISLKTGKTIDKEEQNLIEKESIRWRNIFHRLICITQFLAAHNMAFRGTSNKLFTEHNGNFLGLVQLFAKFDLLMEDHLRRAVEGDISDHYCGKNIQNELINLMANKVNDVIVDKVSSAKYYSIIADCTRDASKKEQLSLTVRYVDIENDSVQIREDFLGFLSVNDTTGSRLTEAILSLLENNGLDVNNCRGQGYDNGSNMKRKNNGVQKRIITMNPLAAFLFCSCHNLNLILCDGAKSSVKSSSLFGILQRLFTIFSASTHRWNILLKYVKNLILKKLSDTRWEAKISSVQAVRYQIADVHDALVDLSEQMRLRGDEPETEHEARALAVQLKDFGFLVPLVAWHEVLFQISVVSKAFQAKDMDVADCAKILDQCRSFFKSFRENGFQKAITDAKTLAKELHIQPVFESSKRIRYVKRRFDEPARDEPIVCPEKKLEIEFFNPLLDSVSFSMEERFEQLQEYSHTWSFVYNIQNLPERDELLLKCLHLQDKLTVNSKSDINGTLLCDELISIRSFVSDDKRKNASSLALLNFIKKHELQDLYPNVWIAVRILLTAPVTVASGDRSFSKLKLIKTYLRSTVSQERLSSLVIISIENEIAKSLTSHP